MGFCAGSEHLHLHKKTVFETITPFETECRFLCKLCDGVLPNSLEFASHLRAGHSVDLSDYVRGHGHSRVQTGHIDCEMCTESVMHDVVRLLHQVVSLY